MFSESGSPTSDYFCPFAKTPNRRSGETSFLLLPAPGPAEPRPSSKLPPAWVGPAGEGWPGVPAWPLPAKESKCGRFLGFGLVYPPDLGPPPIPASATPRMPGTPLPLAPLTLGQLDGARAAQRARQAVELLHRSLHPRRALRAHPAAPAASAPSALHPAPGPFGGRRHRLAPANVRRCTSRWGPRPGSGSRGQPDRPLTGHRPPPLAPFLPPLPLPSRFRMAFWER